jgi:hypothetical protein
MIDSDRQRHGLPMLAPATILRRVCRVDFEKRSASFFHFAGQVLKKLRPRRIRNTFCQTMIVNHLLDAQIFHTDSSEGVDDPSTVLVGEIVTPPFGSFMNTSDHLAMPPPLLSAFLHLRMLALNFCQGLFFATEEARVGNFLPCREGGEGFQPYINADGEWGVWQPDGLADDRKGSIPFSRRGAMNGTGFDGPFERTMLYHFEGANLGEVDTVVMGDAEAALRIGEAVIATRAFKARKAGFASRLAAAKERLIGQIDAHGNILQDLGMNRSQRGALGFEHRIGLLLLKARERNSIALIGGVAHLKQLIIQEATLFQMRLQRSLLFFGRVDPKPIILQHRPILGIHRMRVKKRPNCPIPSRPQKERPFIPGLKTRGFLARFGKLTHKILEREYERIFDRIVRRRSLSA